MAFNIKAVKAHILEELAHGKPIQLILNPPPPQIEVEVVLLDVKTTEMIDDPDWVKPDLPDWNLVVRWLKDDEGFRSEYEHAMKYGALYMADEMLILKNKLLKDPKSAPAYKAAMDMIKWSAMVRDPKYSERSIQEIKTNVPQDSEAINARIKQLEEELGMGTIPVQAVEVKPKVSPKMLAHLERARAAKARKNADPGSETSET